MTCTDEKCDDQGCPNHYAEDNFQELKRQNDELIKHNINIADARCDLIEQVRKLKRALRIAVSDNLNPRDKAFLERTLSNMDNE